MTLTCLDDDDDDLPSWVRHALSCEDREECLEYLDAIGKPEAELKSTLAAARRARAAQERSVMATGDEERENDSVSTGGAPLRSRARVLVEVSGPGASGQVEVVVLGVGGETFHRWSGGGRPSRGSAYTGGPGRGPSGRGPAGPSGRGPGSGERSGGSLLKVTVLLSE